LALCGVLLGYKWQTKNYYQEKTNNPNMRTKSEVNNLTQHESALKSMIESYEQLQKTHATKLEMLQKKQTLVNDLHEKIGSTVFLSNEKSKDVAPLETSNFVNLLMKPSLTSMKDLESDFEEAINDLQKIVSSEQSFNWSALDGIMKQEFPQKEVSHNPIQCSPGGKQSLVPEGAARVFDMEPFVHVLDQLLDKRSNSKRKYYPIDGDTLLSSSTLTVERWLKAKTRNLLSEISKTAQGNISTPNDDQCMDDEKVLDLVEEGLDALVRNANLRSFLRKRAMELDPSAQSIILDADLPIVRPSIPEPEALLLRRVLDKPIIFEIVDWIDKLVEASGGYNDSLDQYLDLLAGSARASIGEIVVESVLQKTEGIEFPHPRRVVEKIAKPYISK
jgi:hypothetical protein